MANIAWGPLAVPASTPLPTSPLTLAISDNYVQAGANLAALGAGIPWTVLIQYRSAGTAAWRDYGSASGLTSGGPERDRQGNVSETGIRSGPFPDGGLPGRQVRAVATLGQAATVSGHVITSS